MRLGVKRNHHFLPAEQALTDGRERHQHFIKSCGWHGLHDRTVKLVLHQDHELGF